MTEDSRPEKESPPLPTRYAADLPGRIDLAPLFAPISPDRPCGEYLRYEDAYDRIQEARREEESDLPAGVWERRLKTADWETVIKVGIDALTHRTKDLQIASWLLEALAHVQGFYGVKTGLNLILGLCERYWEGIYPLAEEDDPDSRLLPFQWINEKMSLTIKRLPVTAIPEGSEKPNTFAEWERGGMIKELGAKTGVIAKSGMAPETAVTRASVLKNVRITPLRFYTRIHGEVAESLDLVEKLNAFLNDACGAQAPSLSRIMDVLRQILNLVAGFLQEKKETQPEAAGQERTGDAVDPDGHSAESRRPFLSIRNREEAYRMLSEAAEYLHIHEPHSPTPYLVKRAVSWGDMHLDDLLKELVADKGNLSQIFKLLGIDRKDS